MFALFGLFLMMVNKKLQYSVWGLFMFLLLMIADLITEIVLLSYALW